MNCGLLPSASILLSWISLPDHNGVALASKHTRYSCYKQTDLLWRLHKHFQECWESVLLISTGACWSRLHKTQNRVESGVVCVLHGASFRLPLLQQCCSTKQTNHPLVYIVLHLPVPWIIYFTLVFTTGTISCIMSKHLKGVVYLLLDTCT